jgi:predicted naringenin-chalcone synthase
MVILGLGTAAPAHRYAQRECWETLQRSREFQELNPRAQAICRKVLTSENGIATRHLALEDLTQAFDLRPDALRARFLEHAPRLATQAAEAALAQAQTNVSEIDGLLISTCTGYLCPGLTSYVGERLGLAQQVLTLDLVGQGCGAALPNLRAAEALISAGRCGRVLSICVEVCSAAFYLDNDPGVLISACLFGDGAGAAVLAREPNGNRRVEWKLGGSVLNPRERGRLCFEQRQGMLRNVLAPEVPELAAEHAAQVLSEVLAQTSVARAEVTGWVLHPGGREVLRALQQRLDLSEADVRWSAAVLKEFGNISSASVYFVMQAALADAVAEGYWWMSSFGAGFSAHGALWKVSAGGKGRESPNESDGSMVICGH